MFSQIMLAVFGGFAPRPRKSAPVVNDPKDVANLAIGSMELELYFIENSPGYLDRQAKKFFAPVPDTRKHSA